MVGNQLPDTRSDDDDDATWMVVVGLAANPGRGVPGAGTGAGSARINPGRRIVAGDTLWDPLKPPHPETRAETAKEHATATARDR
jgi:hypothetical protein